MILIIPGTAPFLIRLLNNVCACWFGHKSHSAGFAWSGQICWSARGKTYSLDPLDVKEPMTFGEVNGTRNVPPRGAGARR